MPTRDGCQGGRAPCVGIWSEETGTLANISLWSRLGCNRASASVLRNPLVQNHIKLTTFAKGSWVKERAFSKYRSPISRLAGIMRDVASE